MNTNYKYLSGHFKSHKDKDCFWQAWIADPTFSWNVVIHHGLGEHSGRYTNILNYLAKEKINIFAYDAYGYGQSQGKRGEAKSILGLAFDLDCFLTMIETEFSVQKPILYGHSMGGLVALYFSLLHSNQEHLSALVLSAPPMQIKLNLVQRIKLELVEFLFFFFKNLILSSTLPTKFLTHAQEVIQEYHKDSLVHNRISLSLSLDIFASAKRCLKRARLLHIPCLLLHGTDDKICHISGSQKLFSEISSENKIFMEYPNLYHEIHNETEKNREKVLQDLTKFLSQFQNK